MSLEDERRRSILMAGATALTGGLAGCTGILEQTGEETTDGGDDGTPTATAAPTTTEPTQEAIDLPVEGEATRIEYGATVSGELTASAPSASEFDGYYQPYTFVGSAGDTVQITMTSPGGDPYLYLLDEQGTVLVENDDGGSSFNSSISGFELPSDGGYVILAGSFSNTLDFEYQLSLSQVESDLRSIAVGETRTSVIDSSDPYEDRFNGYHEPVTLDAEAGATVSISMTSEDDTYLYLLGPNGDVVAQNDDFNGLNSRIPRVTLSESGEYTIIATSFSDEATFTYTLSVADSSVSQSISVGETISGELGGDDRRDPAYNGYHDLITLDVPAGTPVDIAMTSAEGDTVIGILNSNGQIVASNDDGGSNFNAVISRFTPETGGQYTIIATSFDADATFEYELSVTESGPLPDLRSISVGETRTGGIDQNDPSEARFNGYYEPVTLDAPTGTTVDIAMSSSGDTYLYLLDPNGDVVAENDDYSGLDSRISRFTLSASGDYTIIATSFDPNATFEYELSVTEGADLSPTQSIAPGETLTSELDTSDPRSDEFNGYYEPIALDAPTGATVDISMTSADDTYLYLLGPDGDVVARNDDADGLDSEISAFTLSESGDYTIIATSFSYDATFAYELSVSTAGGGGGGTDLRSISPGQTLVGVIDESDPYEARFNGYYEPVTLDASVGTVVTINMFSDDDTYLYLLDPNGDVVAENDDANGLDSAIYEFVLEEPGDYTIIATSFLSSATFEYELAVQEV